MRWLKTYFPTIILIVILCAIYVMALVLIDQWVWPHYLQNGEPVINTLQSAPGARHDERVAFQHKAILSFGLLGVTVLLLYVIFCFIGLIRLDGSGYVDVGKAYLKTAITVYTLVYANIVITLFKPVVNSTVWSIISIGLSVLASGMLFFSFLRAFFPLLSKTVDSVKKKIVRFAGFIPFLLVVPLQELFAYSTIDLIKTVVSAVAGTAPDIAGLLADETQSLYYLRQPIDFVVALFPLLALVFMVLAIKNAAPMSIGSDPAVNHSGFSSMVHIKPGAYEARITESKGAAT